MSLKFKPLAIGSLPHNDTNEALGYIFSKFTESPFWPQLAKVDKREDMIAQYTQNVPGITFDEPNNKYIMSMESPDFCEKLEEFYLDYDAIVNEANFEALEKYGITEPFSSSVKPFLNKIRVIKPEFAKGHITGAFTWGAAICDTEGRCAFFDTTLRDILTKGLALKALWQINEIKKNSPNTTPIIFIDEPALCQCGTSAFVSVQRYEIVESLKEIVDVIKANGALAAIHCCGKADWELVIDLGVDILNLDAFLYAQSLSLYTEKVNAFLQKGGYIAWGIVPTLDKEALEQLTIQKAESVFENAIEYLIEKGIDKKLVLNRSVITPSCGAGSLSKELACKAMEMTVTLAKKLEEKY